MAGHISAFGTVRKLCERTYQCAPCQQSTGISVIPLILMCLRSSAVCTWPGGGTDCDGSPIETILSGCSLASLSLNSWCCHDFGEAVQREIPGKAVVLVVPLHKEGW